MNVIGDVKGRNLRDHGRIVDTANTLVQAAQAPLKEEGAVRVVAYCTHPSFPEARWNGLRTRTWTSWW